MSNNSNDTRKLLDQILRSISTLDDGIEEEFLEELKILVDEGYRILSRVERLEKKLESVLERTTE